METCSVVLLSVFTKFYIVTIQIKPLRQYFLMAPFVFQYFTKSLGFFLNLFFGTLAS